MVEGFVAEARQGTCGELRYFLLTAVNKAYILDINHCTVICKVQAWNFTLIKVIRAIMLRAKCVTLSR